MKSVLRAIDGGYMPRVTNLGERGIVVMFLTMNADCSMLRGFLVAVGAPIGAGNVMLSRTRKQ
jgi:hypothetical protein